jgi:hypothetical protein
MKRHPTDSVSLVFGLLFAFVVGWWGLSKLIDFPDDYPVAGIGPLALLVIGVVGLLSALRRSRSDGEDPALTAPVLDALPVGHPAAGPAIPPDYLAESEYPLLDARSLDPLVLDQETIAEEYRRAGFADVPVTEVHLPHPADAPTDPDGFRP